MWYSNITFEKDVLISKGGGGGVIFPVMHERVHALQQTLPVRLDIHGVAEASSLLWVLVLPVVVVPEEKTAVDPDLLAAFGAGAHVVEYRVKSTVARACQKERERDVRQKSYTDTLLANTGSSIAKTMVSFL